MKRCSIFGLVLSLGGCAISGGSYGPTKAPSDARTSMWSSRPVAELAGCIGQVLRQPLTSQDDGYAFIVSANTGTATYRVVPVVDKDTSYVSQINVFGPLLATGEEAKISSCLLPGTQHSLDDN